MNPKDFRDWVLFAGAALAWVFSLGVLYSRLTGKVNGVGGRLKRSEEAGANLGGRMDRMERELGEIRTDSGTVHERLGRVEKGVDGVSDHMNELKIDLGTHLSEVKQLIIQKDSDLKQLLARRDGDNRERLARLEAGAEIAHRDRQNDA